MFPMNPMMSIPFTGYMSQQPTPEQTAQMQHLALQSQQLQLKQMKQMLEQYAQSIDAALEQIEEQFARLEKGDIIADPVPYQQVAAQVQPQALSHRVDPQALSHRVDPQALSYRVDPQALSQRYALYADRYADPILRSDPQNLARSGMGDFGRPVF